MYDLLIYDRSTGRKWWEHYKSFYEARKRFRKLRYSAKLVVIDYPTELVY